MSRQGITVILTLGHELISGAGDRAPHELRRLDLELLALEVDKAAVKAEELARLRVLLAVHEIKLQGAID